MTTTISNQELRENFDHFDKDSDGKITKQEFRALLEALGALTEDDSWKIGFRSVDLDGNGAIDFEEFALWYNQQ